MGNNFPPARKNVTTQKIYCILLVKLLKYYWRIFGELSPVLSKSRTIISNNDSKLCSYAFFFCVPKIWMLTCQNEDNINVSTSLTCSVVITFFFFSSGGYYLKRARWQRGSRPSTCDRWQLKRTATYLRITSHAAGKTSSYGSFGYIVNVCRGAMPRDPWRARTLLLISWK
jgi:hypothetical protein